MVAAYTKLAAACDYPLHLGVTEAGPAFQGTIKSATAFGALLSKGIGDTIRVSLSAPPVEEVKVGIAILEALNLKKRGFEIISCPSCGRAQVDVYTLAEQVTAALQGFKVPMRVAVMGSRFSIASKIIPCSCSELSTRPGSFKVLSIE